ncbi:hypothetical protein BH09BAC1_BH09BAC1_09080 [soil metagenome]
MDTSIPQDTTCNEAVHPEHNKAQCSKHLLPIRDTLELLSGKWKIMIIMSLIQNDKLRFKELQRELSPVTGKVLSKELKELEQNGIITRTVFDTAPITVEYALTPYGRTLKSAIIALHTWGSEHRKKMMVK